LYTPCILDCALRFSNKILYLLIKKRTSSIHLTTLLSSFPIKIFFTGPKNSDNL
jgi:hypothetical protein